MSEALPTLRVCKSAVEAKLDRVLAALKEQDIETSADYLIVRDIKEYLMIRAKAAAALAPADPSSSPENKK
jgi:hypothetical protein